MARYRERGYRDRDFRDRDYDRIGSARGPYGGRPRAERLGPHRDDFDRERVFRHRGEPREGYGRRREYEDRYGRRPGYESSDYSRGVSDYAQGGSYDREFHDQAGEGGPRTWIGDQEAERERRRNYQDYSRDGYRYSDEYRMREHYGPGRDQEWGDRRGRAQYLRNANIW